MVRPAWKFGETDARGQEWVEEDTKHREKLLTHLQKNWRLAQGRVAQRWSGKLKSHRGGCERPGTM